MDMKAVLHGSIVICSLLSVLMCSAHGQSCIKAAVSNESSGAWLKQVSAAVFTLLTRCPLRQPLLPNSGKSMQLLLVYFNSCLSRTIACSWSQCLPNTKGNSLPYPSSHPYPSTILHLPPQPFPQLTPNLLQQLPPHPPLHPPPN